MSNTKAKLKVKDIVKLFSELDPEQDLVESLNGDYAEPFVRGFIDGIGDQDYNVWNFRCPYENQEQIEMYRSMHRFGEIVTPYKNGQNKRIEYLLKMKEELSSKMDESFMRYDE